MNSIIMAFSSIVSVRSSLAWFLQWVQYVKDPVALSIFVRVPLTSHTTQSVDARTRDVGVFFLVKLRSFS